MGADAALALLVLLALSSVAAFAPSFTRGLSNRHMRGERTPKQRAADGVPNVQQGISTLVPKCLRDCLLYN